MNTVAVSPRLSGGTKAGCLGMRECYVFFDNGKRGCASSKKEAVISRVVGLYYYYAKSRVDDDEG